MLLFFLACTTPEHLGVADNSWDKIAPPSPGLDCFVISNATIASVVCVPIAPVRVAMKHCFQQPDETWLCEP